MRFLVQVCTLALVIYEFFTNERLVKYNGACKVWIQTEMIAIMLELPFTLIQAHFLKKKSEEI